MQFSTLQSISPSLGAIPNISRHGGGVAAYSAMGDALDLSKGRQGELDRLSPEAQDSFLKMLATLLKHGVVGTESRVVDGRLEESFVSIGFADPEFRESPPVRHSIDLRA